MKKIFILSCVCVLVFTFALSANASKIPYEYTATLSPDGVNGSGPVPSTASAVGTFWYDDAIPISSSGYYELGGLYFEPEAITTADPLDCDPINGCLAETSGNFARYYKILDILELILNVPSQSYYLAIATIGMDGYRNNNAYGQWRIDSITEVDNPVPEPATILLLGAGLVGLAGFGRKRFKK